MGGRRYTKEQVAGKINEAEGALTKDQTVVLTCPLNRSHNWVPYLAPLP